MPPAMTEAIWPETLTPTACMSRKFWLSSSRPILLMTRADMGKAEMPAAPIIGFDLLLGEQVVQLGDQNAAHRVEDEGDQAKAKDHQRLHVQEGGGLHPGGDGQAQKQRDQVGQHLLGGLGQAVQHAALTDQVAEHQKADQRHAAGGKDARHRGDEDGEQDLGGLGDVFLRILHADPALFLGGDQADDRRLG